MQRKTDSRVARTRRVLLLLVLAGLLTGCVASKSYRRAEMHARRQNWDQAVMEYSKAVASDPGNARYSVALERAKLKASADHFTKGTRYASAGQLELAIAEFQQTLLLNPGNQHARTELDRAYRELRRRDEEPSQMDVMKEEARRRALEPPKLDPRSNIPILLNFIDTEIGKIFEAMSKASQINFIFDEKTDLDKPMTIDIGNVTLEKALDILMLQTKNFYKVIDEHTLLIAPDTRQKRQEYEDQVIRTFYLSNGDTKQVVTLLRSLLQSRQIAENPDLNSVTIKDTPDKVTIAERIINANDKAKGEVLIDVELLEINRTVINTLGIDLSSKTLSVAFRDGQQSLPLNNLDVLKRRGNWIVGVIPSAILNFLRSDSESRSIAKPQLRVTEGEKAEILIGNRVPIPTTSFNTSQTIGGNIVPVTSFTYQNVGITVQIEPRVHHNKEVTLTVQVEVSALAGNVPGTGGTQQPIIGTRNIQTVIRLRDGETNLLAGLIRTEDQDSLSGVPGVMNVPGLRRVFSNNSRQHQEDDIILTLTPHIIRIPDITEDDLTTLWVGTEEKMTLRGPARNVIGASPFREPEDPSKQPAAEPVPPALPQGGISRTLPPPNNGRGGTSAADRPQQADDPGRNALPRPDEVDEVPLLPEPAEEQAGPDDRPGQEQPRRPQTPAVVRLVPSRSSFGVGETVVLEVVLENAQGVGSVPFHLRYNRQTLQYLGAQETPFLGSDGTNTIFLATESGGGGEIVVGHSRVGGGEGLDGSGTLAVFEFQAVNPGSCDFVFIGASVKDPTARDLPATFVTAPVVVE